MASPCEIIVDTIDKISASRAIEIGMREALRIEATFSRYLNNNIVYQINNADGKSTVVDDETAYLLSFADQCYELSGGLFDITSGILGKVWRFNGSDKLPTQQDIEAVLPYIGWSKAKWQKPLLTLPPGMNIDFGGIGKEYAVDRALTLIKKICKSAVLVNFGGDLHASAPPSSGKPWRVGIEHSNIGKMPAASLDLYRGAITTSGDTQKYLEKNGVRYSHVLNPKSGWPVSNAPHSVTVASNSCTEAGILSTLAMLHGDEAEQFLDAQDVRYWCQR